MKVKEKVASHLSSEDAKELLEGIYEAFQSGGEKKIEEFVKKEKERLQKKFDETKKKIKSQLGG